MCYATQRSLECSQLKPLSIMRAASDLLLNIKLIGISKAPIRIKLLTLLVMLKDYAVVC